MKKLLAAIIILTLIITVSLTNNSLANSELLEKNESIDLNKALNGEYEDIEIKFLTDEEMINELIDSGININQAKKLVNSKYDLKKDVIDYSTNESRNMYLSKRISVRYNYKPKVEFFCEVEVGHGTGIIRQIYHADMDRNYNGIIKQFSGNLHYHLLSHRNIHFNLNGDFFNLGSTTITGGGSIGIEGFGSLSFSVSNSSGHFEYVNIKDDIYIGS